MGSPRNQCGEKAPRTEPWVLQGSKGAGKGGMKEAEERGQGAQGRSFRKERDQLSPVLLS